jgi:hypothetical protein
MRSMSRYCQVLGFDSLELLSGGPQPLRISFTYFIGASNAWPCIARFAKVRSHTFKNGVAISTARRQPRIRGVQEFQERGIRSERVPNAFYRRLSLGDQGTGRAVRCRECCKWQCSSTSLLNEAARKRKEQVVKTYITQ